MNKIFFTLLAICLLHTSVQAADKIRISTPGGRGALHHAFGAEKRIPKRGRLRR